LKIAAWSSDWLSEPVPDPDKSAFTGKQEFKDQRQMIFGGTYYYRLAMPVMELVKHGYESILTWQIDVASDGHLRVMNTVGEWIEDCDLVVLQRHMGRGMDDVIRRARATGQIVINDLDDDFWSLPKSNIAKDTTDPATHPEFNRDHYLKALGASSAITVSTPALYKKMERLGVPVYLVRNMIDIERWPVRDPGTDGMISWIGGIAWRANDMMVLKQFLPEFLEDLGLPFFHGGDSQVPGVPKAYEQIGIDPTKVKCAVAPLCHISKYPSLFEPVNVMLIPLEDVKFNHSKSALKALESSASGLPFIASDLPEQRWFVEHGGAGRLAKNHKPRTWEDHLVGLLDPEVRRLEGKLNRAHAEQFDIRDNWTQWANVYDEVTA
jgi:glycosyltransferase involved in cell wall biosynthesis